MSYPDILHHGAISGATGSCHQLLVAPHLGFLIVCGFFHGSEASASGRAVVGRLAIYFPLADIKALIATHGYIDYAGRIPYLLAAGSLGLVLCSEFSAKLLPIILDSLLVSRFTQGYRELDRFWDAEVPSRLKNVRNPLSFRNLLMVSSHKAHLAMVNRLAQTAQPAIVIAGNGMCSSGRIFNYLKAMLADPRHDVLFVVYQAEGTPGSQIQRFGPRGGYVELDGQRYEIRAQVHSMGGYSAHADQAGLIRFVACMRQWPSEVRIVHGENAKQEFAQKLKALSDREGNKAQVKIP